MKGKEVLEIGAGESKIIELFKELGANATTLKPHELVQDLDKHFQTKKFNLIFANWVLDVFKTRNGQIMSEDMGRSEAEDTVQKINQSIQKGGYFIAVNLKHGNSKLFSKELMENGFKVETFITLHPPSNLQIIVARKK